MAYTPTKWENSPSTNTPLNADNLNKLEQGVKSAHDSLNSVSTGKLDKSAVVQTTGSSATNVMSQDASTKSFQTKGNYAAKGESYTKEESDANFQPKGSYQAAGYSYSKAESDAKYQAKGESVAFDVESLTEDDIAALKLKLGIS